MAEASGGGYGGLIDAGIALFNGFMGRDAQEETNEANSAQALRQMEFQERMSNTSHQREVKDLEAAGLNPILSASKGASTPSGAMAVMSSPYQAGVNAVQGVSQGALNRAHSAKANQETETEKERTSQAQVATEQSSWIKANMQKVMEATISKLSSEADISQYQAEVVRQTIPKIQEEVLQLARQGRLTDAHTANVLVESILKRLEIPEATSFANFFSSAIGKAVPYVREAEGVVSSAAKGAAAVGAGRAANSVRRVERYIRYGE